MKVLRQNKLTSEHQQELSVILIKSILPRNIIHTIIIDITLIIFTN